MQVKPDSRELEAVRVLVIQHGQREGARLAGKSESTVRSWCQRYGWNKPIKTVRPIASTPSVADNVASTLAQHEGRTKLGLAKYASDKAQELADSGKLKDHKAFKDVTTGAGILHKWNERQDQANVVVNIALLGVDPESVSVRSRDATES